MQIYQSTDYIAGELSEAFTRLDPELAAFHHDMKVAGVFLENTQKGTKEHDIALYKYDSAKTAYQTRLLEVRSLKFKLSSDKEKQDAEQKRQMHELSMQETMNERFAALRKKRMEEKRRKEESSGGWFFYFILGMWLAQMQHQMNNRFRQNNEMRNDFSKAQVS
jgi:hypothetical protein